MLSSCGGRLLSGAGGSSSSSSGASSSSGGRNASQVELLVGASTSSNSSEPHESGQLNHWHQHKQNDEFISVNGAIFTLSNNQKQQQQQQQQTPTGYLLADNVNLTHNNSTRRRDTATLIHHHHQTRLSPETKSSHLEQHKSISQPRPLNRQHQYRPIHQQLQRIYGNKLQEFEQINRQQKQATQTVQTSGKGDSESCQMPPPSSSSVSMQTKQLEHVFSLDGHLHQRHLNHHHHHHHHPRPHANHTDQASVGYHQHGSQTYDSLIVSEQALPPQPPLKSMATRTSFDHCRQMAPPEQQQTYQSNLYDFNPRPMMKAPPPVQSERTRRMQIESEYDANNNVTETKEFEMGEEEEEEQLVLVSEDEERGLLENAKQIARQSSKLLIDSRKRQMESLHYATATAAALLNVTASAAAAFAVSDKNLVDRARVQQQQQQLRPKAPTQPTERRLQTAFTGNMATGAKLSSSNQVTRVGEQQLYEFGYDYAKQPAAAPPPQRQWNNARNQMQQLRPLVRDHQQAVYQLDLDQNGLRYQQQHQNRAAVMKFNQQHQPVPAFVRPPQSSGQQQVDTRPGGRPMTQQQLDLLRRYKLQMQSQASGSQLAVTRATYGANLYNNLQQVPTGPLAANAVPNLAMLQARDKLAKQQQLLAAAAVNSVDPRLLMLASSQLQNGNALAGLQNEIKQRQQQQQQVAYGLLVPAKVSKKQPQPLYAPVPFQLKGQLEAKAIARQSHYQLGAITSNSSETSGHSNVPLILNRAVVKPAKSSLIDKIAHIDLTIFWWILLAICVIFITAVITITRHLI